MNALLDSSFVIDLLNEIADGRKGSALRWLDSHKRARLWVSPITVAEVLEGANDPDAVRAYLSRFAWQAVNRTHADRVAMLQRKRARRLGENDAWQCAIADVMGAVVVGSDAKAFSHLGELYENHRRS
jgi:predicted nucleic acid-binding protein